MSIKNIQVYCPECKQSYWFSFDLNNITEQSGVAKRSLIHGLHTLVCDIDKNGSVRTAIAIPINFNEMEVLIEKVAQNFNDINREKGTTIQIDAYTSNIQFRKFIQRIISKMFEQATNRSMEENYRLVATSFKDKTTLHADRLHISVGPFINQNVSGILEHANKGIILDINDATENQLDIFQTISSYQWVVIIKGSTSSDEELLQRIINSLLEKSIPYYTGILSNKTLQEMFNFISAITMDIHD
ncbi:MAG: hypothetical protein OEZ01_11590 [Candidatus Heimdallarchaeota archaeon]|nr:hypothetical protein [Candidatus Heimdallarchaeota archaeon]MDH5646645.1 hypothetical protein [Candidatus Heimdallarchaeota archaeon]